MLTAPEPARYCPKGQGPSIGTGVLAPRGLARFACRRRATARGCSNNAARRCGLRENPRSRSGESPMAPRRGRSLGWRKIAGGGGATWIDRLAPTGAGEFGFPRRFAEGGDIARCPSVCLAALSLYRLHA